MSRHLEQQEGSPPKLYDTSISSRGESLTSWSTPHSNGTRPTVTTNSTSISQTRYATSPRYGSSPQSHSRLSASDISPRKKMLLDNTNFRRNSMSSSGMITDVAAESTATNIRTPTRKDVRLGIDTNLVNAVNRYTSDLYEIHKSPKNKTAISEPGIGSNSSRPSTNIYTTLSRAAAASPLVPYDEAAATATSASPSNNSKSLNPIVESPSTSDYDIRERIRRLQQMKEDREKAASNKKGITTTAAASTARSQDANIRRRLTVDGPTTDNRYRFQPPQQQTAIPSDEQKPSSARDLAKLYELQQNQQKQMAIEKQRSHDTEKFNDQRKRLQQNEDKHQINLRKQPKGNMSKGFIPSKHSSHNPAATGQRQPKQDTQSTRQHTTITTTVERQRSRSLPPDKRNRQSTGAGNDVGNPSHRDEAAVLRKLQYDGRVAEIETPSSARVCELKTKLWSPNEHLLVATKPSEYSEEDAAAIARIRQQSDSDKNGPNTSNFNLLNQKSTEMPGTRVQRGARSLSPKSKDQRNYMYRDFHRQQTCPPIQQEDHKSVRFKSRYYEAAQRNLATCNPSVRTNVPDASPRDVPLQSPRSRLQVTGEAESLTRTTALQPKTEDNQPQPQNSSHTDGTKNSMTNIGLSPSRTNEKIENWQKILERSSSLSSKNTTPYIKVQSDEDPQTSSNGGSSKNEETVASLIAKLGAVRRDDPHAALEQIDAILMAESSRSDPGGDTVGNDLRITPPANVKRERPVTECLEEKKTESLDVDRQPNESDNAKADYGSRVAHGRNARILRSGLTADVPHDVAEIDIDGSDDDDSFFDETTVSSITNPTYASSSNKANDRGGYIGSNAASGRPRPSNLQLYNNSSHLQSPSQSGPPDSASPYKVEKSLDKSDRAAGAERSSRARDDVGSYHRSSPSGTSNGVSETDNISSKGLAEQESGFANEDASRIDIESKIRRWGKLSGITASESELDGTQRVVCSTLNGDDVRSAVGNGEEHSQGGHASNESQRYAQELKRDHPWDSSFPSRLGKVEINDTTMDSAAGVETTQTTKTGQLRMSPTQNDSRSASPVYRMRMEGAMQLDTQLLHDQGQPSSAPVSSQDVTSEKMTPWRHESTKAMSDEFDSAWVSLPSSTFFKGRIGNLSDRSNRNNEVERNRRIVESNVPRLPDYSDASRQPGSLAIDTKIPRRDELGNPSPVSLGSAKGRGIRGFLKRTSKGSSSRSSQEQISNNSPSIIDSKSSAQENKNTSSQTNGLDTERGRGMISQSESPLRGRAKSLDERRIRNPSIARKFSRLLRVYEMEKEGMEGKGVRLF